MKNQNAAGNFRDLRGNFQLMMNLLIREGNRGWETINTDPPLYDAVTADDIARVASTYFEPENRAVAIYYREEGEGAPEHPALAGLDDQERQQVRQLMAGLEQIPPEQLPQLQAQIEQMAGQVPADNQDMVDAMRTLVDERLEAADGPGGGR